MVMDNSEDVNDVPVSAVSGEEGYTSLEEALAGLVKDMLLSPQQQDLLMALLLDYADVFAQSKSELGRTDVLQHEIVTSDAAPIRQRFRRLSPGNAYLAK